MDNTSLFCLVIIGITVVVWVANAQAQAKKREEARQAYLASLSRLKSDPANPDLKQRTLSLGRVYSSLTRNSKGVTVFDEVALMNDINAATAAATAAVSTAPTSTPAMSVNSPASVSASLEERLSKLSELKAKGLIDEAEYAAKRQKIIDEV